MWESERIVSELYFYFSMQSILDAKRRERVSQNSLKNELA